MEVQASVGHSVSSLSPEGGILVTGVHYSNCGVVVTILRVAGATASFIIRLVEI